MKEFSKKKPDELLNKYKVKIINRNLTPIKEILADEPTVVFLDLLDEETLPSNSDAVLILGQFSSAMEQFRSKFYRSVENSYTRRWVTKENPLPKGKKIN